jgi:hypothetical protein
VAAGRFGVDGCWGRGVASVADVSVDDDFLLVGPAVSSAFPFDLDFEVLFSGGWGRGRRWRRRRRRRRSRSFDPVVNMSVVSDDLLDDRRTNDRLELRRRWRRGFGSRFSRWLRNRRRTPLAASDDDLLLFDGFAWRRSWSTDDPFLFFPCDQVSAARGSLSSRRDAAFSNADVLFDHLAVTSHVAISTFSDLDIDVVPAHARPGARRRR